MQVDVLQFEDDIRGRWAAEAMRWMLQSSSRHLTTRSHQVLHNTSFLAHPSLQCVADQGLSPCLLRDRVLQLVGRV